MIKQKWFLVTIFTITLTQGYCQNTVNQYDNESRRHGLWSKNYYQTDQRRYEGQFKHGKEIDTFKYYTLNKGKSVLSAIKVFNEGDSLAKVTFFASNKKIISSGSMNGKRYIGKWLFYHKNSDAVLIEENYNSAGVLSDERHVYYKNGQLAESANYQNGKLQGESKWFSENNVLLRVSNYQNGLLNGKTTYYDGEGQKTSEGFYRDDKKHGIWYYYENGNLKKEIDHTNQKVLKKY